MKMTIDPSKADARFVLYSLQATATRNYIASHARGTSGTMKKISQGHVQNIPIPQIPIEKQKQIVAYLDEMHAKIENFRNLQTHMDIELATFTPALLAKAFRGEL